MTVTLPYPAVLKEAEDGAPVFVQERRFQLPPSGQARFLLYRIDRK